MIGSIRMTAMMTRRSPHFQFYSNRRRGRLLLFGPLAVASLMMLAGSWLVVPVVGSSVAAISECSAASPPPLLVSNGLLNLGNTCYLNSQLQCAYHIPLVKRLILEGPRRRCQQVLPVVSKSDDGDSDEDTVATAKSSLGSDSTSGDDTTTTSVATNDDDVKDEEISIALQAMRRTFQDMDAASSSSSVVVAPRVLCQSLGIPVFEQQDSQEFWKLLLPALKLSALTDLYTGAYQDYIVALDGSGRERRREESFLDLSLEVSSHSSVEASLKDMFGTPELLSLAEGNAWRPEKGADLVDAHKGELLQPQGLPSILQLHLKRFSFDWNTETTTKLNNPFEFPEQLDLSSTVASDDSGSDTDTVATASSKKQPLCVYDLQAVVVHVGEFGSGHYYVYVRPNIRSNEWYRFNDDKVDKVSFQDVVQDAYGGKSTSSAAVNQNKKKKRCFLKRLFGGGRGGKDAYGYGGKTSNAYVLQYVRTCDVPKLYDLQTSSS